MQRELDPVEVEPDAWCAWCGDPLPEPEERSHNRRFCCLRCSWAMRNDDVRQEKLAARPMRACLSCGAVFKAWPLRKRCCTPKCSKRHRKASNGLMPKQ